MDKKTKKRIIEAHEEGKQDELHHDAGRHIGELVYGANDGIVSSFAIVSAVTGAALNPFIVLVIGVANLIADGFSMAAGNYLSSKSEIEYVEKQRSMEKWEIENIPEEERKEIRRIYRAKGLKGNLLDKVVEKITGDPVVWVDTMMTEELNLPDVKNENPVLNATITFFSFVIAGFMPILPYALGLTPFYLSSIIVTGITLFSVGAARSVVISKGWFRSGLEMLIVGALAASVAYGIGWLLAGLGQSF